MHIILPQFCEVNFINLFYRQENHNFILKTFSSSYPDEGRHDWSQVVWPQSLHLQTTGPTPNLVLVPVRGTKPQPRQGERLTAQERVGAFQQQGGGVPPGRGWRTWLSFQPFDPPLRPPIKAFDSSPPHKELGGREVKIQGHKMKKGTKQMI